MVRFFNLFPFRAFVLTSLFVVTASLLQAQITSITDSTTTPIEGAGHDYIHLLSETVNPANGSLSFRLEVPIPKGRGLTIPFSFDYDSNAVNHLVPTSPGNAQWQSNTGYLSQGGWSYSVPMASFTSSTVTGGNSPNTFSCSSFSNYMFQDPSGGQHALGLATQLSGVGQCPQESLSVQSSGDSQVAGFLPKTYPDPVLNPSASSALPITVLSGDGTVYNFPSLTRTLSNSTVTYGLPSSIEDRNGNEILVTDNGGGNFSFQDTVGRAMVSSNGFGGPINNVFIPGSSYKIVWGTTSVSFTAPNAWVGDSEGPTNPSDECFAGFPPGIDNQNVITAIVLPDNGTIQFHYGTDNAQTQFQNPFGLLNEIDYPSGASVKYAWATSDSQPNQTITGYNELLDYPGATPVSCNQGNDNVCYNPAAEGCLYEYNSPVVVERQVSFNGTTPSLTQLFSYSTSGWTASNPPLVYPQWTTKVTTVTSTDNVLNKTNATTYTYSSITAPKDPFDISTLFAQLPIENEIQYYDYNSTLLRTVFKTWYDQYDLKSEQTVLNDSSQTSQTTYCYIGIGCSPHLPLSQLGETDEYDYGASAPTRRTVTGYQNFATTLGAITNEPCKTVVYDSNNHSASETDYLYDGGTTVCGASNITPSVTGAGGSTLTGHDETNFASGSQIPRGNLTTKIEHLNGGANVATTYTYDETGQVTSMTDPDGNVTRYSYADSFVNTNASGFTTTAGSPPSGQVTNAYLTQITHPSTNGVQHIEKYSYGYNDGQLTTSADQNQQVTTYHYDDPFSRPTETDYPDGGQPKISYGDGAPPTVETTKPINSTSTMETITIMDGVGHVVQTDLASDPEGTNLTDSSYDGLGHLYTKSNPHRTSSLSTDGTTTYVYDGLGRVCLVIPPGGTLISSCPTSAPANDTFTSYFGNCSTVTDAAGKARKSCSDALGRMTTVFEDPNGLNYETDYQYDVLNNLLGVTQKGGSSQANWRTRSFTYDSLSRLLTATNPESGTVSYSYDANGNLLTKTDARGIITTTHYDSLNRLLSKTYSDGTPPVTFYYDGAPAPWASNEQNTNGHLVEVTTGTTPQP